MKCISVFFLCAASMFAADFTTGQAARLVIGQQTFTSQDTNSSDIILGGVSGLAYAADTLFVADGRAHHVMKMTLDGKILDTFGKLGPEPGHFFLPHGITVDKDGAVYVTEINGKRVNRHRLTPGDLLALGETTLEFRRP